MTGGEPKHPRTERRHEHGDAAIRSGGEHRVPRLLVPTAEGDGLAAQQGNDDPERLFESIDPMVAGEAERLVFGVVPPGAETEDQPATAHLVGRCSHLGDEGRAPEARAQDERPDLDALGHGREALTMVQASCMPSIGPFAGSLKKWSNIHTESRPCASAARANDRIAGQPGVEPSPSTSAAGITTPTFTGGL